MAAASHTAAQTTPQTRVAAAGRWSALSECGAEPPALTAADFPVHYAQRTARPAPKTGATKTGATKGQTKTLQTAKRVSAAAPVVHGVMRKPVVASKAVPVAKNVTTRAPVKAAVPTKVVPAKAVAVPHKTRIPCPVKVAPVKTAPVKAGVKAPVKVVVALPKVVSVPKKAAARAPTKAVVAPKAVVQAKIVTPPKDRWMPTAAVTLR
ncbi:hypothetical protein BC831DRAFT_515196 [Entophlyctis helioformis]|nr:hypothetical protein BC831DRAFT_515196 [Entophlyctis helioformis]